MHFGQPLLLQTLFMIHGHVARTHHPALHACIVATSQLFARDMKHSIFDAPSFLQLHLARMYGPSLCVMSLEAQVWPFCTIFTPLGGWVAARAAGWRRGGATAALQGPFACACTACAAIRCATFPCSRIVYSPTIRAAAACAWPCGADEACYEYDFTRTGSVLKFVSRSVFLKLDEFLTLDVETQARVLSVMGAGSGSALLSCAGIDERPRHHSGRRMHASQSDKVHPFCSLFLCLPPGS